MLSRPLVTTLPVSCDFTSTLLKMALMTWLYGRAGYLPRGMPLGGLIEIHGEGGRGKDWTNGCVALVNEEMDDLFSKVDVGTPVTIVGADGNGGTFTKLVSIHRAAPGAKVD